jgi:hypothetical protein
MSPGGNQLLHGPLGRDCFHVCVDMQRMFAEDTPWRAPWCEFRFNPARDSDLIPATIPK